MRASLPGTLERPPGVSAPPRNDDCSVPAGDPSPGRGPADTCPLSLRGTVRLHIHQPLVDTAERSGLLGGPDGGRRPVRVRGADERPGVTPAAVLGVGSLCSAAVLAGRPRAPLGGGGRGAGAPAALGLAAGRRAATLFPPFPDLVVTPGFFFCSLSPRACVVFPSRFRAVEASCLFLRLPPALSTSQAPAHAPELARVQGRCQHRGPALPSAPSPRPLCPLASGWGGRRPGPCPLPPAPLRLRRRFQSNTGHRPDGPLPSQALGSRELDGVPPFSAQLSRPRGWGAALPPGTRAFTPDTAGGMGRAPWLPRGASIRDVA